MDRTRRAALGLATRYLGTAVTLVVALVTVPILLHWLGPTRFAAFRVSQEYLGYLALLEFGLGGVLMVGFARAFSNQNQAERKQLLRYGARSYLRLAGLSAIGIVAFIIAAPKLFRIPEPSVQEAVINELRIGLLLGMTVFLWSPLTPLRYQAEAEQRGYVVQIALILQSITTAVLAVGSAVAGGGLVGQFAAVAVGSAAFTGFLVWDAFRRYRDQEWDAKAGWAPPEPPRDRWRMFVYALCSQMSMYSDSIIISLVLGVDSAVPFTVTQRLLLLADSQILALGAVTWAALADLHHRGETDRMNRRLITLSRATAILSFGIMVPVAVATPAFTQLWVGPIGYGGAALTAITFGWTCQHGLIALWGWPLSATGHVRKALPPMVIGSVVNVVVSVLATAQWGLVGPAIGTLVNYTFIAAWWLPLLLRETFGTSITALVAAALRPALLAVPFGILLLVLVNYFPIHELPIPQWGRWCVLVGSMGLATITYFVLAWFFVMPREDRNELRARLRLG